MLMAALKNNYTMKKIFFILLLGVFTKSFGQTVPSYTYLFSQNFTHNINYEYYTYDERLYNPSRSTFVNLNGSNNFYLSSPRDTFVNYNVPVDLSTTSYWFSVWGYRALGSELDDFYNEIPIQELIKGSVYKHRDGEAYSVLTPNDLSISNLGATEVCAGEMLNLIATPAGFHKYVYHWQYTLDGYTWNDVPEKVIGGYNITNTEVSRFSIYDLLGQDHKNHFGPIYFRIGYNQDRLLSVNTIQINYSPCGPTVSSVDFKGPACSGDIVKSLSVTFNEKLNSNKGEKLATISVVDITDESKIFMQVEGPVSYPDDTKMYTYTDLKKLENGHTYRIKYQAQVTNPNDTSNATMRGFLYSPQEYDFTYNEPQPLTFKISANNPNCHEGLIDINIEAEGGTPPYFYDDLNGETKTINGNTQIKRIQFDASNINKKTVSIQQVESKQYSIKVTDNNKCIEQ